MPWELMVHLLSTNLLLPLCSVMLFLMVLYYTESTRELDSHVEIGECDSVRQDEPFTGKDCAGVADCKGTGYISKP